MNEKKLHNPPKDGIFLVSCVSKKRSDPIAAKELYVSDWFIKARGVVEATGCPWYILSAKYGLLDPDAVVAPYDATLKTMKIDERREWSHQVYRAIRERHGLPSKFVFLAGATYRQFLVDLLLEWGATIEVPLEGLRIGEQLQRLGSFDRHV